jgi:hypothetical protein
MSSETRPIKVTKLVQNDIESPKDRENTENRENTGKVTAVVAVMTVFCNKIKNSLALNQKSGAHAIKSMYWTSIKVPYKSTKSSCP